MNDPWIPVPRRIPGRRPALLIHDGLANIAARPYRLAGTMALAGFVQVFLYQLFILWQIILGAPVFEELLKFGLALLVVYPLRFAALRIPVAAAVGASFGVLEHALTYADESAASYAWRVAFHGGATALSVATFHVLERSPLPMVRWASTLPATFLHYVNNVLAVWLLGFAFIPGTDAARIGSIISITVTVLVYAAIMGVLLGGRRLRAGLTRRMRRFTARWGLDPLSRSAGWAVQGESGKHK